MSAPLDAKGLVRQWIRKGENDLINARHTLTMGEDCPLDTVCFHAQQAAEKYLKAALVAHDIDFPWTHELTALAELLPQDVQQGVSSINLTEIDPYAVEGRYPGPPEDPSREDAVRAVEIAEQVRDAIRRCLPPDLLGGSP